MGARDARRRGAGDRSDTRAFARVVGALIAAQVLAACPLDWDRFRADGAARAPDVPDATAPFDAPNGDGDSAVAVDGGSDAGFDDARDGRGARDSGYAVVCGDQRYLDVYGGDAGMLHPTSCGCGQVAVGLFGRAGALVQAVGLYCAVLHPDGTLGPTTQSEVVGGNSEVLFDADMCPGVVVGIHGATDGGVLGQLQIDCAPLDAWLASDAAVTPGQRHGETAGTLFSELCPSGTVLVGLEVTSDTTIHSIHGVCESISTP